MDRHLEYRYIVIKAKDLTPIQLEEIEDNLRHWKVPQVDCVVIEEDWPEYQPTVDLLWERIGKR